MRIKGLAACLLLAVVFCDTYAKAGAVARQKIGVKKRMEIDVRPHNRSLVGCLIPAFRAAGRDWSREFLYAYFGQAFLFDMRADGAGMWHDEDYVYGAHVLDMLERFADGFEIYSVSLNGQNPATIEEMARTRERAWNAVCSALDEGLPAIVWQPISQEMADENPNPMLMRLPAMWSLIVGYDELAQTYVVDSPASGGRYTIRWDAFGHVWPASKKFCAMIIKPETGAFDPSASYGAVIQRAIETSRGLRPGNTKKATAHGLAAWEMWLEAFRKGKVATAPIRGHAIFLKDSRGWAVAYLKEVAHHFPEDARVPLRKATEHYEGVHHIPQHTGARTGSGRNYAGTGYWIYQP